MNRTEQEVYNHVEPIAKENDLKLVEVSYVKEGPDFFLRVYLDKKGGITLDDCAAFSEIISAKLDDLDIVQGAYYLDVSSPGAERPIKDDEDLELTLEKGIYIKTYQQIDGEKEWTGVLKEYDDKSVTIEYKVKTRKKTITVEREKIATIRKAVLI
ncbi:ribosome maturation factor RimP [Jeotgalicoccus huakuii]|uniref:ribosome maturation factor RimP n=1 Tax=Jeotgalicoccus TaxID=227979 RepID=UPI000414403F|nr:MULTISPECIES: ribosome maturation factor RimP [Jeotgalicoccus]MCK1975455.1 ribosome maturation factor RimP [Jeotgalicoccus huakuii]QQD85717.1 ribosome maturation factor RimP [Jeotgalicoccus sp. ATCC 8456]